MTCETAYRDIYFYLALVYCIICDFVNFAFGAQGCMRPEIPVGGGNFLPDKPFYDTNDTVFYGCRSQLYVLGTKFRTCQSNGTWSGSLPHCTCHRPGIPSGGGNFMPQKDFYDVNDTVSYECSHQPSMYLFGNKSRICLPDGSWSGSLPYCVQKHRAMHDEEFFYSVQHQELFDNRNETCLIHSSGEIAKQIGFRIRGTYNRILVQTTTTSDIPCLSSSCSSRLNATYETHCNASSFKIEKYKDGSELMSIWFIYYASIPFTNPEIKITLYPCISFEANKICEVIVYTDLAICSQNPPAIENGFWSGWKVGEKYYYKQSFKGVCEYGYKFYNKAPIATCSSARSWSVEPSGLHCRKIECSERPPELQNSNWLNWYRGKVYPVSSVLVATCKYGYINYGQPIIVTCNDTGYWSPEYLEDACQEEAALSPQNIAVVAIGLVVLLLVLSCAGYWIFWKRRVVFKWNEKSGPEKQLSYRMELNGQINMGYRTRNEYLHYKTKDQELKEHAMTTMEDDHQYEDIKEDRYVIPPDSTRFNKNSNRNKSKIFFTNELLPSSNSALPMSDDEGYLVPSMSHRIQLEDKESEKEACSEMNTYYTIPDTTPR